MHLKSTLKWTAAAFVGGLGLGALTAQALADPIRIATFNASLNRNSEGELMSDLADGSNLQAQAIAEIIQRVNPDVLLINEFDYDEGGVSAQRFQDNYLSVGQNGADPVVYAERFIAPSNTGIPSGFDLDNSGGVGDFGPGDAFGFGFFPGQFGMAVYSKLDIDEAGIRTFQNFLWKDVPDNLLPTDYYSLDEQEVFRLSSKSHWGIPIVTEDGVFHFLASHPTPPVFDGPEDRNGRRNHDEIRFWSDYVNGEDYIYDDDGTAGGLGSDQRFVIAGDQNADPFDGDSTGAAALQLLDNDLINATFVPTSDGGAEAAGQGGDNDTHLGNPAEDTADFGEPTPGNLRVDYVLPSVAGFEIVGSGVFWPLSSDPLAALAANSDHRLVYIDVELSPLVSAPVSEPATLGLLGLGLAGLAWARRRKD